MTYPVEALIQRKRLYEEEILWLCAGVPDLDNPDQQLLFMGSAGRKCYGKSTRDHYLIRERAPAEFMPENKSAPRHARWAVHEESMRVAA